jgi:hypothetical protein
VISEIGYFFGFCFRVLINTGVSGDLANSQDILSWGEFEAENMVIEVHIWGFLG